MCCISTKDKATDSYSAYFISITTLGWVDIFTRLNRKNVIIDAEDYYFSSARNYACLNHDLEAEIVFMSK